jgi:hypothetical protein
MCIQITIDHIFFGNVNVASLKCQCGCTRPEVAQILILEGTAHEPFSNMQA